MAHAALIVPIKNDPQFYGSLLGPGYLVSMLEKSGHTAHVVMPTEEWTLEQAVESAIRDDPDFVAIALQTLHNVDYVKSCCAALRSHGYQGAIVVGGHTATILKGNLLSVTEADIVLYGDAEHSIVELADRIARKQPISEVDGAVVRVDGHVVVNRPASVPVLDDLPFPRRIGLDYLKAQGEDTSRIPVAISGSRGCRYNCAFCSVRSFQKACGVPRRARSARSIVEEMIDLNLRYGTTSFVIWDDDFIGSPTPQEQVRIKEFIQRLHSIGADWSIVAEVRADHVNASVLEGLRRVGLSVVLVGIESGDDAILRYLGKGTNVEINSKACKTLHSLGIRVDPGLIMFTPISDMQSIRKTISFIRNNGLEGSLSVATNILNKLVLCPGTRLVEDTRRRGLLRMDRCTTVERQLGHVYPYQFQHEAVGQLSMAATEMKSVVEKYIASSGILADQTNKLPYRLWVRRVVEAAIQGLEEMISRAEQGDQWEAILEAGRSSFANSMDCTL